MLRSPLGAIVVLIALSGCLAACAAQPAPATTTITVSVEHCGRGWSTPHAGQQSFLLANEDIVAGEVFLVRANTGDVVAYVDNVAPGASAELPLTLGSGRYQFRCAMADRDVAIGATVVVPGTATAGTSAVAAVTDNDLVSIAKAYQAYVQDALPGLRLLLADLSSDLGTGNLSLAKTDWLHANLAYQGLGGAYGAFGDLASRIDGTAAGLRNGTADEAFTGFHRIEYGLWHGQTAGQLAPFGIQLVSLIGGLTTSLAETRIAPLDVAIRAHEIAENALQFELTGESDFGSGTELASVGAELDGTSELLRLLTPLLKSRYPGLPRALHQLEVTRADIAAFGVGDTWTPADELSTANRERVNSDVSELAELLAPIASICEPRRSQ
jgi:iron uptake system component EfeO